MRLKLGATQVASHAKEATICQLVATPRLGHWPQAVEHLSRGHGMLSPPDTESALHARGTAAILKAVAEGGGSA